LGFARCQIYGSLLTFLKNPLSALIFAPKRLSCQGRRRLLFAVAVNASSAQDSRVPILWRVKKSISMDKNYFKSLFKTGDICLRSV